MPVEAAMPHGDPIPTKDGKLSHHQYLPMSEVSIGDKCLIKRLSDHEPEMVRYMHKLGLLPGVEVKILHTEPFEGPIKVQVGKQTLVVGYKVSKAIYVDLV